MKALRVNADYESVLFHGRPAPAMVNHSLEFLAFFLSNHPVLSSKNYDVSYLDYVQERTGHRPIVLRHAEEVENWWGPLTDVDRERWWNSKLTSSEFLLHKKWVDGLAILTPDHAALASNQVPYLLKDPHSMSGQKFQVLSAGETIQWRDRQALIAEPLLNRKWDFSNYIFPDQRCITYQNLVDQHFQYRGTIFSDWTQADIEHLPFYSSVDIQKWQEYRSRVQEIIAFYRRFPNQVGFSIDAFVYEKDGLLIYPMCEVNYRRTMGRIAFELSEKFALGYSWTGMFLFRSGSTPLWKALKTDPDLFVLSPGDTRFEIIFLRAKDQREARERIRDLEKLLPNSQASINF